MKLTLKVFDRSLKNLSIGDKIRLKIPSSIEKSSNTRWNKMIEVNIEEKTILELIEHIIDKLESNELYIDSVNQLTNIRLNKIDKLIKPARAWKKIQIKLTNMNYETNKATRISLFEELINNKKINLSIANAIQEKASSSINKLAPREDININ